MFYTIGKYMYVYIKTTQIERILLPKQYPMVIPKPIVDHDPHDVRQVAEKDGGFASIVFFGRR